jgi:anti-sigma-K factor RskA
MLVTVNHLEATTGDQVYMVWATPENGAVSKVGWFTVDSSGWAVLEYDNVPTSPSLWVFICREPNGGVTKPTGPIIVSGTLST